MQARTPPILNIEKTTIADMGEYKCSNMAAERYKNVGIEYDRRNDLQIFKSKEAELKTLYDSAELPFVDVNIKNNTFLFKKAVMAQRNAYFSKSIDKKAMFEDMDIAFQEFIELDAFGKALRDYVNNLQKLVKKLDDIPSQ
jgi:hypothetical protein